MADEPSDLETADEIVELWHDSVKKGLSGLPGKNLDPGIQAKHEPLLKALVQKRLDDGHVFMKSDERNTKQVAKDLGKICRMLTTKKNTIDMDTFEAAFVVVKRFHDVCLAVGGGDWCGGGG